MSTQTLVYEGILSKEQEKGYVYVPFDLPEGVTRLEVSFGYSDQIDSDPTLSGGNTVDLGIFDARGIEYLNAGFRGWSGSERDTFVITETEATPAYVAGPLMAGRWHVLLGCYKIAQAGCQYRVTVTLTTETGYQSQALLPQPVHALPASPPSARFAPWRRGQLHCHTFHSDGECSPQEVVAAARAYGFDFLAITDHNMVSSHQVLATLADPGLILVLGVECTTFKGHFNVWGIGDWVDFRVESPEQMAAAVRYAVERGAVTSCNHPFPFGPNWDYPEVRGYHCVEVWNGPWHSLNETGLEFWLNRINAGERIPAIGGSDWHRHADPNDEWQRTLGTPTVWLYVPGMPTAETLLQAVRQGHISLSDAPDGPFLDLRGSTDANVLAGDAIVRPASGQFPVRISCRAGAGYRLQLLDQKATLFETLLGSADEVFSLQLSVADSLYVRAELRDPHNLDRMRALTNPIYFVAEDRGL